MIWVLLAIAVSVLAGTRAERRYGDRARRVTERIMDALLYAVLPFITFFVIARLHLSAGVGVGLALAYLELGVVGLAGYALARRLGEPRHVVGTIVLCGVLANTGYLGIPLNAALLGHGAIAPAIAWDTVVSGPMFYVAGFAIGAAFGTTAGAGARERTHAFLVRNPPLVALVLALLVPDALAPHAVVSVARAASIGLLPVGFFILGVHLMHEREDGTLAFPPPVTRPLATVLGLRLVLAPGLLLGLAAIAAAAGAALPHAYLVQAAMPCGINALVVSHAFGLDLRLAAGAVAWSTAVVIAGALVGSLV